MTSKEKTIRKIESFKILMKEEKMKYGRVSLAQKLELEYYEEVLKDLEKYEKIKSMLYKAYEYNNEEYIMFIEVIEK